MNDKIKIRICWILDTLRSFLEEDPSITLKVVNSQLKIGVLAGYKIYILAYAFLKQIKHEEFSIVYKVPNNFYDKYFLK